MTTIGEVFKRWGFEITDQKPFSALPSTSVLCGSNCSHGPLRNVTELNLSDTSIGCALFQIPGFRDISRIALTLLRLEADSKRDIRTLFLFDVIHIESPLVKHAGGKTLSEVCENAILDEARTRIEEVRELFKGEYNAHLLPSTKFAYVAKRTGWSRPELRLNEALFGAAISQEILRLPWDAAMHSGVNAFDYATIEDQDDEEVLSSLKVLFNDGLNLMEALRASRALASS